MLTFSYRALANDDSVINASQELVLSGDNKDKILIYLSRNPEQWAVFKNKICRQRRNIIGFFYVGILCSLSNVHCNYV